MKKIATNPLESGKKNQKVSITMIMCRNINEKRLNQNRDFKRRTDFELFDWNCPRYKKEIIDINDSTRIGVLEQLPNQNIKYEKFKKIEEEYFKDDWMNNKENQKYLTYIQEDDIPQHFCGFDQYLQIAKDQHGTFTIKKSNNKKLANLFRLGFFDNKTTSKSVFVLPKTFKSQTRAPRSESNSSKNYQLQHKDKLKVANKIIKFYKINNRCEFNDLFQKKSSINVLKDVTAELEEIYSQTEEKKSKDPEYDPEDGPIYCRFCFCYTVSDDFTENMLISPCKCKGSSKYIHFGCLKRWIQNKFKILNKGYNNEKIKKFEIKKINCNLCKESFPYEIAYKGKVSKLISIEMPKIYPSLTFFIRDFHFDKSKDRKDIYYISLREEEEFDFGTNQRNDLTFKNNFLISRFHFKLKCERYSQQIVDLESRFGTHLVLRDDVELVVNKKVYLQVNNVVFLIELVEFDEE